MSELHKYDVIYLQVSNGGEELWSGDVTWCQDRIHDEDIKYIRADLVEKLRLELETQLGRLAACGVVAMANTRETSAEARKMRPEYRSASLDEVERAVDREMQYQEELATIKAAVEAERAACQAVALTVAEMVDHNGRQWERGWFEAATRISEDIGDRACEEGEKK